MSTQKPEYTHYTPEQFQQAESDLLQSGVRAVRYLGRPTPAVINQLTQAGIFQNQDRAVFEATRWWAADTSPARHIGEAFIRWQAEGGAEESVEWDVHVLLRPNEDQKAPNRGYIVVAFRFQSPVKDTFHVYWPIDTGSADLIGDAAHGATIGIASLSQGVGPTDFITMPAGLAGMITEATPAITQYLQRGLPAALQAALEQPEIQVRPFESENLASLVERIATRQREIDAKQKALAEQEAALGSRTMAERDAMIAALEAQINALNARIAQSREQLARLDAERDILSADEAGEADNATNV